MFAIDEIPEHSDAVFAARGAETAVGGDGDCADVTGVSVVVCLELALCEVPDLGLD